MAVLKEVRAETYEDDLSEEEEKADKGKKKQNGRKTTLDRTPEPNIDSRPEPYPTPFEHAVKQYEGLPSNPPKLGSVLHRPRLPLEHPDDRPGKSRETPRNSRAVEDPGSNRVIIGNLRESTDSSAIPKVLSSGNGNTYGDIHLAGTGKVMIGDYVRNTYNVPNSIFSSLWAMPDDVVDDSAIIYRQSLLINQVSKTYTIKE